MAKHRGLSAVLSDRNARASLFCLLTLLVGAVILGSLLVSHLWFLRATDVSSKTVVGAVTLAVLILWVLSLPLTGAYFSNKLEGLRRLVVFSFAVLETIIGLYFLANALLLINDCEANVTFVGEFCH
jgi:hypothetical protein